MSAQIANLTITYKDSKQAAIIARSLNSENNRFPNLGLNASKELLMWNTQVLEHESAFTLDLEGPPSGNLDHWIDWLIDTGAHEIDGTVRWTWADGTSHIHIVDGQSVIPSISAKEFFSYEDRLLTNNDDQNFNPDMIESKDGAGNTPLHLAAEAGLHSVIKELIDMGADLNAEKNSGATPAYLVLYGDATNQQDQIACLKVFINAGVDIHAKKFNNESILDAAKILNLEKVEEFLNS